jgi:hypothetical protein
MAQERFGDLTVAAFMRAACTVAAAAQEELSEPGADT